MRAYLIHRTAWICITLITVLGLGAREAWAAGKITTAGSGAWSSTTNNAPWPGGTKPAAGDWVEIAAGHTVTLDESTPALGAAGIKNVAGSNTSVLDVSGTVTINGPVSHSGTAATGFITSGTGDALTILGLVTNSSTGCGIVASGTASLTITNTDATAISNSSSGTGVGFGSTGALQVTGLTTQIGTGSGAGLRITAAPSSATLTNTGGTACSVTAGYGAGVVISGTNAAVTINGDLYVTCENVGYGAQITGSGAVVTLNGLPILNQAGAGGAGHAFPVLVNNATATLVWTGSRTLAAGTDYMIGVYLGTVNLTDLACVNGGNLLIRKISTSTITKTRASIVNVSAAAGAAIIGDGQVSIIRQFSRRGN